MVGFFPTVFIILRFSNLCGIHYFQIFRVAPYSLFSDFATVWESMHSYLQCACTIPYTHAPRTMPAHIRKPFLISCFTSWVTAQNVRAGGRWTQKSKLKNRFSSRRKKEKESEKREPPARFELASTARKSDALTTRLQMPVFWNVGQTVLYLTAFLSVGARKRRKNGARGWARTHDHSVHSLPL